MDQVAKVKMEMSTTVYRIEERMEYIVTKQKEQ